MVPILIKPAINRCGFIHAFGPRKDHRGVDLISDALPFGRLWYDGPNAASNVIGYAKHRSRSHDAVIRVYDEVGNVIETHEVQGRFPRESQFRHKNVTCVSVNFSATDLHEKTFRTPGR